MAEAPRDQNFVPAALFEIDGAPGTVMAGKINSVTGRILVDTTGSAGTGDVVGPASSTTNDIPQFADTTGKLLKDGLAVVTSVGNPGSDSSIATEKAVRTAVNAVSGSGITRSVNVTAGNVTAGATAVTDYVYLVAGAHTITLPTCVGNTDLYTIKNNHSANITVNTTSAQTIDGTTSISISPQSSVDIISSGTFWSII